MKNCLGCKWAEWEKTKAGKLHPSGKGKCKFPYALPQLPAAMYWLGDSAPIPYGGKINRQAINDKHCAYYLRAEQ